MEVHCPPVPLMMPVPLPSGYPAKASIAFFLKTFPCRGILYRYDGGIACAPVPGGGRNGGKKGGKCPEQGFLPSRFF